MTNIAALQTEYESRLIVVGSLKKHLLKAFSEFLSTSPVTLGATTESRIKTFKSISEKVIRNNLQINSVRDLNDLIGLRVIVLFSQDLILVEKFIRSKFEVIISENKVEDLGTTEFGYRSKHFIISLKANKYGYPDLEVFDGYKFEIQLRTLIEHAWASASHKLQYKKETDVPRELQRGLNRVAANLETADREIERFLDERNSYKNTLVITLAPDTYLNVDILEHLLDGSFPAANKDTDEPYSELLSELRHHQITRIADLEKLLRERRTAVIKAEEDALQLYKNRSHWNNSVQERHKRGVHNTYAGLLRLALIKGPLNITSRQPQRLSTGQKN